MSTHTGIMKEKQEELLLNWTSTTSTSTSSSSSLESQDFYSEITLRAGHTILSSVGTDVDDEVVQGGCDSWMAYWRGGDLSMHTLTQTPVKLQMIESSRDTDTDTTGSTGSTGATGAAGRYAFMDTKSAVCSDASAASLILDQLTRGSSM